MSGPNTSYDPVEVTPLDADQVEAMREQALAAIAAAGDLAELKPVRLAHAGDRSPLALANREIGALPPQAARTRPASGSARPGGGERGARGPAGRARGRARRADARRGGGRRHPADDRAACRRAAPAHHAGGADRRRLRRAWATRSPTGPRSRPSGSTSTRSTSARTTRRAPCRTRSSSTRRRRRRAAHPHLAGAGPHAC